MRRALYTLAMIAVVASGTPALAHHSYASYDTTRVVEIQGVIEEFEWVAPHSLLKVRAEDGRLYIAEWRAPISMQRIGIERDTLKKGDHIVVTGNPRRDFDTSGIVNFKSVQRPSDGWKWPNL